MDGKDLAILRVLLMDGRASYRSIGRRVGLSTSTVRSRVLNMLNSGLITRFIASLDLTALGYSLVHVVVKHRGDEDYIVERLRLLGNILMSVACVGDITVFGLASKGMLKERLDLLQVVLQPNTILYTSSMEAMPRRLLRNDLRIIRHLLVEPRASIKSIASRLNISARTVKRRLEYMVDSQLLHFTVLINPLAMKDFINFSMIITLDDEHSDHGIIERISRALDSNLLMPFIPVSQNRLVGVLYSESVEGMNELIRRAGGIEGVINVDFLIAQRVRWDDGWIVRVIDGMLEG
ncbi:MAG: AsnC family transcriptional regulator [Candidatus Nitrosocaldus sp.]|nr:AsnC family transcriptional regulator [Candidatus Nitrosocaldus sp.]MCS7141202.1 AsnC family transcriptional regulator [Candidatus Nitrosocaldus sp.]MDW8000192.1 AsnC family transcriptional regulator [Candidatus Nitrosocaldus sp.]MDW8275647.1 AsnC family transcriptional regulator [Candidatus Nitrosocaldus sp.]